MLGLDKGGRHQSRVAIVLRDRESIDDLDRFQSERCNGGEKNAALNTIEPHEDGAIRL